MGIYLTTVAFFVSLIIAVILFNQRIIKEKKDKLENFEKLKYENKEDEILEQIKNLVVKHLNADPIHVNVKKGRCNKTGMEVLDDNKYIVIYQGKNYKLEFNNKYEITKFVEYPSNNHYEFW